VVITIPRLHEAQHQIRREGKRYNVVNCGRRFGKNVLCHFLLIEEILNGNPVAWGAPTYKNLAEDWRTLKEILAPIQANKSEQEKRIECITGGTVEMWSLDSPEPIRGHMYKRWVINEASTVPHLMNTWNEIVLPTLIDLKGDAWFPSTPKGKNDFYSMHVLGRDPDDPRWKSWTFTSYANPYISDDELDQMRQTMTEEAYRQEILAEFLENEGAVFRNIDAASTAPVTKPEEHKHHTIVIGVDWGKQDDFTAVSAGCVECKREVDKDRFNQIDYWFQVERVMAMYKKWNCKLLKPELNSMGEPITERLQREGLNIIPFKTTLVSKQPLIEGFALALETGQIQLINDPVWSGELEAYERKVTQTGLSKYSAPEGLHDDTVMARALMYRAMQEAPRQRYDGKSKKAMEAIANL